MNNIDEKLINLANSLGEEGIRYILLANIGRELKMIIDTSVDKSLLVDMLRSAANDLEKRGRSPFD